MPPIPRVWVCGAFHWLVHYFSLISDNFWQGANDESLHFPFKSTEQVGNFTSRSIRPLCVNMSQKCKFCFITEVSEDSKSLCLSPQRILHNSKNRKPSVWWISRDQSSDKLIIFLDLTLNSQNARIDSQDSRIDSWKFQESICKWLSTYFWVVLYNGRTGLFQCFDWNAP